MSKKQQHKEKKRHKQKKERQKRNIATEGMEALKRKVLSESPFGVREVVLQPASAEKMSEVLMAFVEPYRELATTRDAFERLIALGVVAWNAALFPKDKRQALVDETAKSVQESAGKEAAEDLKHLLNELIKRKERYFASNRRLIVSYQVTEARDTYHLAVVSTPTPSPQPDERAG